MSLDYTYRIQAPHRPGSLALVTGAIGEGKGLIGDVTTLSVGREASEREITNVFALMLRRYSNAEIGRELFVSLPTVKTHVGNILRKLGIRRRRGLF